MSMNYLPEVPADWAAAIAAATGEDLLMPVDRFLSAEAALGKILYPPRERVFEALSLTPLATVRAVILGQDPYHGPGQAHGLSFSVATGVKRPPSLRNIHREYESDLGFPAPAHGHLGSWAASGVLMLNTVLTVEHKSPASHRDAGWHRFTDTLIAILGERSDPTAFILWGAHARQKGVVIDRSRHLVIESPHPSPYSAASGFFGSKPFSRVNDWLRSVGRPEIDWKLD